MSPDANVPRPLAVRAEDVLPDGADRAEIGGVSVRKGTVAAFLHNAMLWSDPTIAEVDRNRLTHAMAEVVPSLRALGLLTVFEARDERLRAFLASC